MKGLYYDLIMFYWGTLIRFVGQTKKKSKILKNTNCFRSGDSYGNHSTSTVYLEGLMLIREP